MSIYLNRLTVRTGIGATGTLLCAAFCLFAATADAATTTVTSTASRAVQTSDLDLTRLPGRQTLDRRLQRAADQVCTSNGIYNAYDRLAKSRCVREAIEAVLPDVLRVIDRNVAG